MKIETAEFVLSAVHQQQFLADDRPQIAFIGRSNVGKSSLLNKLLGRQGLARTSSSPGRTQAVNYFLINRRLYFVDLPGYGYAKAPQKERQRWAEMVDRYFRQSGTHRLLIQLVDGKVGATPLDLQAIEYVRDLGLEPLIVVTKIDKVPRSRRSRTRAAIEQQLELPEHRPPILLSAVSGEGIRQLWREIDLFLDN